MHRVSCVSTHIGPRQSAVQTEVRTAPLTYLPSATAVGGRTCLRCGLVRRRSLQRLSTGAISVLCAIAWRVRACSAPLMSAHVGEALSFVRSKVRRSTHGGTLRTDHGHCVSTHTCGVRRCARAIHRLDRRLRRYRRTCNLRRGGRDAYGTCARQGVHAHSGCSRVSPVRPYAAESHPLSIAPCNAHGRCRQPEGANARGEASRSASATSWAVQRKAGPGYAAAVLSSALGASTTKVRAQAMGSERLSAPLDSGTCACSRRTPPRTSRRGAARAQRRYDGAAPGRCGDAARCRTDRTRTARAIPPLQRYGR
jgi:hypothetical protein